MIYNTPDTETIQKAIAAVQRLLEQQKERQRLLAVAYDAQGRELDLWIESQRNPEAKAKWLEAKARAEAAWQAVNEADSKKIRLEDEARRLTELVGVKWG